jgi:hypothetical protein
MLFGRLGLLPLLVGLPVASELSAATNPILFNRDVRPILSENCFVCHGHDPHNRRAKLRLDVREVAIERGAIVPGQPAESKLVEHIYADNPDDLMPPPETNKSLSPAQKALLKAWIAAGADYEPHWAYIQPKLSEVPRPRNAAWVRNPIDAFILQGLEARNVQPSPEADKRTLLRRLSLDLIGLPPTPEEVKAYLSDTTPAAYERQVDRLLRSPHFGERMAVPWLDLVRYADTVGYHGDQNQNNFPYRDYVIAAFNSNMPFDQFTIEQLGGDLLPEPSVEARIATGFNRQNMMTREGGAQAQEYLAKYAADRVRTVSMAWLGSTMGCAECHDHKYDPFTSKDFYQMEAFFADLKQWGVYSDYAYTPAVELKGYGNDHPFPPEIQVENPYLQSRIVKLRQQINAVYAAAATKLKAEEPRQEAFQEWRRQSRSFLRQWPSGWAMPQPEVALTFKDTNSVAATNFAVQAEATISFSNKPKESAKVTLTLTNMWVSAIRLELVAQEAKEEKKTARKKRNGTAIALAASLRSAGKETKLSLHFGEADQKEERYAMSLPIIGVTDLWQITTNDEPQTAVWLLDKPVQAKAGDALVVSLGNAAVASARVSVTPFPAADPLQAGLGGPLRKALGHAAGRPTAPERDLLQRTFLLTTQWDPGAVAQVRKLQGEIRECRSGRAFTMVAVAREPAVTRVLRRGNWQDDGGEVVEPGTPHFLPQLPNPEHRRLTRLDLARWLVSPENPLTARAVMNRLWKQFFGTGISAVVDDLGAQGEWPAQPELLDWLACEFVQPALDNQGRMGDDECPMTKDEGSPKAREALKAARTSDSRRRPLASPHPWDVKHMVKLMVMSATYRQDSNQRPDLKEIDPNNRLLACQTPRRLEAEFVRDNALCIAGLLNEEIGGPSAHPYQPPGYYANLQFPDRDYYPDKDECQYRRGIYTHWQRTFLHPMLANFDAPSREECTANRPVSNTPQQALTLLNDPTFVEAARVFAARLLIASCRGDEPRLDLAFEQALARPARNNEKASLLRFLAAQREHFAADTGAAGKLMHVGNAPPPKNPNQTELAAWTQVCRVILNLQEAITRY